MGTGNDLQESNALLRWLRTLHGMFTVIATVLAIMATWWQLGLPRVVSSSGILAIHARIDAEVFNRDTRLLMLDQTLVERQPAGHALAGDGCGVGDVGRRKRGPAGRATVAQEEPQPMYQVFWV